LENYLGKKKEDRPVPNYDFKKMIEDLLNTLSIDSGARKYIKQALGKEDFSDV
jgi:hypothetical protein